MGKVKPSPKEMKEGLKQLTKSCIYKQLIHIQSSGLTTNQNLSLLYVYFNAGCRYYDIGNWYKWKTAYTYTVIQVLLTKGYLSIVHTGTKTTYTTLTDKGMKICKSLLAVR